MQIETFNLQNAYEKKRNAEFDIWDFERHIRLSIIEDLLKQSNAQKVQLTFEKQAQRGENGETWRNLQKALKDAEIAYEKARLEYEVELESLKRRNVNG